MSRATREFWFRIAGLGVVAAMLAPQARSSAYPAIPEKTDQGSDEVQESTDRSDEPASPEDPKPTTVVRLEPAEYLHRVVRPVGLESQERQDSLPSFIHHKTTVACQGFEPAAVRTTEPVGFRLARMMPAVRPHAPPLFG